MHPKDINLSAAVIRSIDNKRAARGVELDTGEVGASSVQYCLRRQWYSLTSTEVTDGADDFEKYKLYQGDISEAEMAELMELNEPYFVENYSEDFAPIVNPIPGMRHSPDRILYEEDRMQPGLYKAICPIEFKNLDTYTFMKICLNGVKEANYPYYVQSMLYAYVYGFEGTKFFATCKSPAAVKTDIERKLKSLSKKPGVKSVVEKEKLLELNKWSYEEWIPIDMAVIEDAIHRKDIVTLGVQSGIAPEREYEPGKSWNCDYCPYMRKCMEDYGDEI